MDDSGKSSRTVANLLRDLFDIGAVYQQQSQVTMVLRPILSKRTTVPILNDRLRSAGFRHSLDDLGDHLLLKVDARRRLHIPVTNFVLFVVTLVSVYFVPVFTRALTVVTAGSFSQGDLAAGSSYWERLGAQMDLIPAALERTWHALGNGEGVMFTIALVSMLFVHEMGHFLASRRRDIVTSWPYFIPAPNIIGTFGAVIKSKSPFWNRRDLIEVGAAGPVAGWLVAGFWLIYGLTQSVQMVVGDVPLGQMHHSLSGESILMRLLTVTIVGAPQPNSVYILSEAAFAGWVGMLVTAINMLPIGQLDGGHVIYGLARRTQHALGLLAVLALVMLGTMSPMWWLFAIFGVIFGVKHPPTLDDSQPVSRSAVILGLAALAILILSFTPVPFAFGE